MCPGNSCHMKAPKRHFGFYATKNKDGGSSVSEMYHTAEGIVCIQRMTLALGKNQSSRRQSGEIIIDRSLKLLAVKNTSPAASDHTIHHQV